METPEQLRRRARMCLEIASRYYDKRRTVGQLHQLARELMQQAEALEATGGERTERTGRQGI